MADDTRLQSAGFEPGRRILRMSGYAAAAAFCAVSVGANLQYGLSLGRNPIDKATYAVASVAADIFKMAAPLLALSLWSKRFHILAVAGLLLWLGCVGWSMASAVGFVLSSRGDAIAERAAEAATRHGWEAKVERAENQLATLGKHRPPDVIKAELASAAVPLHIWRRSRQCLDLTLEESRLACAPVLGLRKELAAAEAAERLEAQLVAGRTQLATASVAGSVADPQASALARLIGADEGTIRTGIALLLAGLIEVGSALGITLVSTATVRNPPPPSTTNVAGSSDSAGPQGDAPRSTRPAARERRVQIRHTAAGSRGRGPCTTRLLAGPSDKAPLPASGSVLGLQINSHANPPTSVAGSSDSAGPQGDAPRSTGPAARDRRVQIRHTAAGSRGRRPCTTCLLAGPNDKAPLPASGSVLGLQVNSHANPQSSSRADSLGRWIETRLNMDPAGSIPARNAYIDFCRWARASGIEPCTETRFGRDFSARIIHLGGVKVKRRDRAYYHGVVGAKTLST